MLSRVADSIYWMNRYMERAENVARFIDVNLHLSLDVPAESTQWTPLVATTGDDAYFREHYGEPSRENVLKFLSFDAEYGSSILSCVRACRENARSIREIISSEMWEQVNKTYLLVRGASPAQVFQQPSEFFALVKQASHLFVGITYLTMTHNEAWHFGRLGRLLERADKTSRILDVMYFILPHEGAELRSAYDELRWGALLKSASALEMYRKRFGRIAPREVVDFLLHDSKFPRSLRYCTVKAERSLHAITRTPLDGGSTPAEAAFRSLRTSLLATSAEALCAQEGALHAALDGFQTELNNAGGAIYQSFFAPRDFAARDLEDSSSQNQRQ